MRRRYDRSPRQFRRVNGRLHLPALRVALDAHVATQTVGAVRHDEPEIAAQRSTRPSPKFNGARDNLIQ